MKRLLRVAAALLIGLAGLAGTAPAQADELPTFTLRFKPDGTFEPATLRCPRAVSKIELINEQRAGGISRASPLRKEKVLGPG